jgi:imidazolonepropionase-like amidohydrolase
MGTSMTANNAPQSLLFENASVVDGIEDEPRESMSVFIEGGRIAEVSDVKITASAARRIDLAGKISLCPA